MGWGVFITFLFIKQALIPMKKLSLLIAMLSISFMTRAQLTVNSLGRVGIGDSPDSNYVAKISGTNSQGVSITREGNGLDLTQCGLSITSTAYSGLYSYGLFSKVLPADYNSMVHTGVYGMSDGSPVQNYGVFGRIVNGKKGAAICGSIASNDYVVANGSYAGYFVGATHVQGDLSVSGTVNGVVLGASASAALRGAVPSTISDVSVNTSLQGLTAHTFLLDIPSSGGGMNNLPEETKEINMIGELDTVETGVELSFKEKQLFSKQHYGLSADQLEEVFPDLVYENEDGTKSINYVEMVPILVQAINELKGEIEELRTGGDDRTKKAVQSSSEGDSAEKLLLLSLGQNKPNPFSNATTIEVCIPEDVQKAFIYVYDLQGKKVEQVDITARGMQNIQLTSANLTDGMYLYSLIADGKVVETRRMIVEK